MKSEIHYRLQIFLNESTSEEVSSLLSFDRAIQEVYKKFLTIKCSHLEGDPYIDHISEFAAAISSNKDGLKALGIGIEDIRILILYQYESQCNLEFLPQQLKSLADLGLGLSISCWQTHHEEFSEP